MRIVLGSDHGGFALKEHVKQTLAAGGHTVTDVGPENDEAVDYPGYAHAAATLVATGEAEVAVLACGSGNGVCIVANKVPGVRAVNAHDADEAALSRRHNHTNVVTLAGNALSGPEADHIVAAFLATGSEGGRHARRVGQIAELESA